jgi:hypothetical protein
LKIDAKIKYNENNEPEGKRGVSSWVKKGLISSMWAIEGGKD